MALLEILLELLLEIGIEFGAELLTDVVVQKAEAKKKRGEKIPGPLSFLGYSLVGGFLGLISTGIVEHRLLSSDNLAVTNLIVSPIIAGLGMAYIGRIRKKRDKDTIRLETFVVGWAFAFAFALVRLAVLR